MVFKVFLFRSQLNYIAAHLAFLIRTVLFSGGIFFEICDTLCTVILSVSPNIVRARFSQSCSRPVVNANILNNRIYKTFLNGKHLDYFFYFPLRFGEGSCYLTIL